MERVWKPSAAETPPNCPRCGCCNTKFCYYNNYSLTQPRYFCKGCRRYWTKGGSLRNVPVGGGCRKNRRGITKSLRLSTESKIAFGYGHSTTTTTNGSIGHRYAVDTGNASFLADSASARPSMLPDGSHIDLALVYANFLSQKPDISNGSEIPEASVDRFDPSLEVSIIQENHMTVGSSDIQLMPRIIHGDHHGLNNDQLVFFCGSDSFHKQLYQDRGHGDSASDLPPLPGQEPLLWSGSHHLMFSQTMPASRDDPPMVGPEEADHQEESLLIGNWSPFDLPTDVPFSGGHENI